MKAMVLRKPIGLDRLTLRERPDSGAPGASEIREALHGSSLNYHEPSVASGRMLTVDGRIPLADGVGIVEAVTELQLGDNVIRASSRAAAHHGLRRLVRTLRDIRRARSTRPG